MYNMIDLMNKHAAKNILTLTNKLKMTDIPPNTTIKINMTFSYD
jgi:hypothetical protein